MESIETRSIYLVSPPKTRSQEFKGIEILAGMDVIDAQVSHMEQYSFRIIILLLCSTAFVLYRITVSVEPLIMLVVALALLFLSRVHGEKGSEHDHVYRVDYAVTNSCMRRRSRSPSMETIME